MSAAASALTSFKSNSQSEAYYKNHLEIVGKENKQLKQKVDQLERENKDLKKSLYELSIRYNSLYQHSGKNVAPFNIDSVVDDLPADILESIHHVIEGSDRGATNIEDGRSNRNRSDGRKFTHKYDLKGHTGAVYVASFSPDGRQLASGSFDKTVRLWNLESRQAGIASLAEHQLNVSDLSWSNDSCTLASGSFDGTVKTWDVAQAKLISSFVTDGFVQAVSFNPADNNVLVAGTTHKQLLLIDRRLSSSAGPSAAVQNDSMINTLYVYRDGSAVKTGDSRGNIKTWDMRMVSSSHYYSTPTPSTTGSSAPSPAMVDCQPNDDSSRPISYLHTSSPYPLSLDEGRYLGVNSYDNVVRVYDRGFIQRSQNLNRGSTSNSKSQLTLMHAVTGLRNKNWPIRSSFFHGHEHKTGIRWRGDSSQQQSQHLRRGNSNDDDPPSSLRDSGAQELSVHSTLILASGSADNYVYIFDVGGPPGTGELVQKLEGHTDRVYSVSFHPQEPILASCSADGLIKIWSPKPQISVPL
mmetsp:Transcript_51957/g.86397  ORF Transcript_51957/g.86397 Transcript_51957/m.86397 type:complete len:524 (-) Transcript_51957:174-1745(-)